MEESFYSTEAGSISSISRSMQHYSDHSASIAEEPEGPRVANDIQLLENYKNKVDAEYNHMLAEKRIRDEEQSQKTEETIRLQADKLRETEEDNQRLRSESEYLTKSNEELKNIIQQVELNYEEHKRRANKLQHELSQAQESYHKLRLEADHFTQEKDQKIGNLSEELRHQEQEFQQLKLDHAHRLAQVEDEKKQLIRDIYDKGSLVRSQETVINEMKNEIGVLKEERASANAALDNLKGEFSVLSVDYEKEQKDGYELRRSKASMQAENDRLKSQHLKKTIENDELKRQLQGQRTLEIQNKARLESVRVESETRIQGFKQQISDYRRQLSQFQRSARQQRGLYASKIDKARKDKNQLQMELLRKEQEAKSRQDSVLKLHNDLEQAKGYVMHLQEALKHQQGKIAIFEGKK